MKKPTKGLSTKKAIMTGAAIISLSAGLAPEAAAATGTGAMSASVLAPIVVSGTQVLNFGSFTVDAGGTGGNIVVAPTGARTTASPGIALVTSVITPRADIISVTAASGALIDLTIPAGTASDAQDITITDGYLMTNTAALVVNNDMVVGNFIIGNTAATAQTVNVGGAVGFGVDNDVQFTVVANTAPAQIPVGATLLVNEDQDVGLYQGNYSLEATYN